jgi:hypothetical protein
MMLKIAMRRAHKFMKIDGHKPIDKKYLFEVNELVIFFIYGFYNFIYVLLFIVNFWEFII